MHHLTLIRTTSPDALASTFATSYAGVVAFITVVAEGNFTKASDRLGIGRSTVTRGIQKLEAQVGARLLSRTTRSVSMTREGEMFHALCHPAVVHISQAMEDLRDLRDGPPRGRLRIAADVAFGRKVVAPLLWDFQVKYPEVELELVLTDAQTDLTAERIDVAFRSGRMDDSQIIAKQIVPMQMLVCASREYVAAHGMPDSPDDLVNHSCINLRLASGRISDWEFRVRGETRRLHLASRLTFNDSDMVLQTVLRGRGLAQIPGFQAYRYLRDGRLLSCMPQYAPDDRGHFICYLSRQHLPSRVRIFVDHMTTAIRELDLQCEGAFLSAAR